MTERACTDFRYRRDRPDASAPNRVPRMHRIAIASSIVGSGTKDLRAAKAIGLREDEGKAL